MARKYPGLFSYRSKTDGLLRWRSITAIGGRPANGGKRIYRNWGVCTRDEAERRHCEVLDDERFRLNGLGPPKEESLEYTFDEAAKVWTTALESAGRDEKTIKAYKSWLRWSSSFFGSRSLSSITVEDSQAMRVSIKNGLAADGTPLKKSLTFRSRRNIEVVASMLFHYACDPARRWSESNPFSSLVSEKPPKQCQKKGSAFRRLHPRQDEALLAACSTEYYRCAIAIGLYLGVRETPVVSLRLEDINLFAGVICVPCEFNKGHNRGVREDQWMPIPKHLLHHLRKQYENAVEMKSPWLFPTGVAHGLHSKSGHLQPKRLFEAAIAAAGKIGYMDANFHALRAIANNRIRASGIAEAIFTSAKGARGILGHASEESAKPYIDADVEYLRPIIEAYDRWLDRMEESGISVTDIREKTAAR